MSKSEFNFRRKGKGLLITMDGTPGMVLYTLYIRGMDARGHVFGNDELIKLAAAEGKAFLGLSAYGGICVKLGPFKAGRAKVNREY